MGEKVRIPFVFHVRSARVVPDDAAAEVARANGPAPGAHDVQLPFEIEWHDPAAVDRLTREARRKHEAERKRAHDRAQIRDVLRWRPPCRATSRPVRPRICTVSTRTSCRGGRRWHLPPTPRPRTPRNPRRHLPCSASSLSNAASTGGSLRPTIGRALRAPTARTRERRLHGPHPRPTRRPRTAADDGTPDLLAGVDPLPRPGTASKRGLARSAADDSAGFDAASFPAARNGGFGGNIVLAAAQEEGGEERDAEGRPLEPQDDAARADWFAAYAALKKIDPGNPALDYVAPQDWTPTREDVMNLRAALAKAQAKEEGRSAEDLTLPSELDAPSLGVAQSLSNNPPAEGENRIPIGRRGEPLYIPRGSNKSTWIGGRLYSGHALDEMQSDGITKRCGECNCSRSQISVITGGHNGSLR